MPRFTGAGAAPKATVVRPANTTTYAAGDVLSNSTTTPAVLTFDNATLYPGGVGVVTGATASTSGNETVKPDIQLWLFDALPTAMEDNDPFDPTDAEIKTVICVIEFATGSWYGGLAGAGGNSFSQGGFRSGDTGVNAPLFASTAGSRAIYGIPVIRNAYVPLSAEEFSFRLWLGTS